MGCRFHYPLPPLNATMILEPLDTSADCLWSKEHLQSQANKIFQFWKDFHVNTDITYRDFLNSLGMIEELYIMSLQSKLTKPHVFLKKNSCKY